MCMNVSVLIYVVSFENSNQSKSGQTTQKMELSTVPKLMWSKQITRYDFGIVTMNWIIG